MIAFPEKDGLFTHCGGYTKFSTGEPRGYTTRKVDPALQILCDSINKNKEVKGLLICIEGDTSSYAPDYSAVFVLNILHIAKVLLTNLCGCIDIQLKKEGVIRKTILNGIPFSDRVKKRIDKLPLDTTTKDLFECFKNKNNNVGGFRFGVYISYRKLHEILSNLEGVGSDDHSLRLAQNAIKEIDEVLNIMKSHYCSGVIYNEIDLGACVAEYNAKIKEQVIKEMNEAEAIEDNTQTLTLNRPKQQENKIITVGNKKAYQVGKGDYKHRNGVIKDGIVIKEEKAEMNKVYPYPVGDKNILADLEDLLNNIIDNPDTVDNLVNYLEKNAPAAHFISEMIGCGEVDSEESLIGALNKATSLSQGMVCAGKNVNVQGGEYKVFNYLNIDYPKPIFGREFSLKQLSFCFDVAAREVEDILNKAKEEGQEEKEEVTANDDVQEHTEEDAAACDEYPTDLAELEKLLEERRKEVADLTVEVKQAEEDKRRRELINELIALDKQKAELNARKAELNKK